MKIRKALFIDFDPNNEWSLLIKDDENNLINFIAIPPTKKDRVDIFLEIREKDCIKSQYIYDFKGNVKKIKGEKIIIDIKKGIPTIR